MNALRRLFFAFRRSATVRVGALAFGLALVLGVGLGAAFGAVAPRQAQHEAKTEIRDDLVVANGLGWGLEERRNALRLLGKLPSVQAHRGDEKIAFQALQEVYPEFESIRLRPRSLGMPRSLKGAGNGPRPLRLRVKLNKEFDLIGRLQGDWPETIHTVRGRFGTNGRRATVMVGPGGPRTGGTPRPPAWGFLSRVADGEFVVLPWGDGQEYLTSIRRLPRRDPESIEFAVVSGVPVTSIDAVARTIRRQCLALGFAFGLIAGTVAGVGIARSTRRLRKLNQSLESRVAERTAELARAERSFRSLFENAPFGLYQCDLEGRFVRVNPTLARIFGFSSPQAMIEGMGSLQALGDRGIRVRFLERLRESGETHGVTFAVGEHGRPMWLEETARVVGTADQPLIEGAMHDVTEQRALEDRLRQIGATDPLTGLLNRRGLEEAMAMVEAPVSFVTLDLDGFKKYNDTFGHPAGDTALRTVAEAIRKTVRSSDIVARAGGEEFVVVMSRTPVEGARRVAESLREAVAACIGLEQRLTVSGGVASATTLEELDDAFLASDRALYRAKESGRNRIVVNSVKLA